MERAILASTKLLKDTEQGDVRFDKIRMEVDTALQAGMSNDLGLSYIDDFESRYAEGARMTIPLPWPSINAITGGGIAPGEMFVVVASAGGGEVIFDVRHRCKLCKARVFCCTLYIRTLGRIHVISL